jgi:hypothetical protein
VAPLVCANILEVDGDGVVRIHESVLLEDAKVQVLLISEQAAKKSRLTVVLIFGLHVEVCGGNDLKVRVEELNMVWRLNLHALLAAALEDALLDVSIIEEVVELDRAELIGGPLRLVPVVVKLTDCDVGDTI